MTHVGCDEDAGSWAVAEVLGVDGPFSFPEKLLQQIWSRREFDLGKAITTDGLRVEVANPGRWNHLGGPDFRDARLLIDGRVRQGDVEVHLRAADWKVHGHSEDPAYRRVVLHVVLFPTNEKRTEGFDGLPIPILPLLPLLFHDLEEYAADAAVASLANRPSACLVETLGKLTAERRRRLLAVHAERRWAQKVRFARLRVERLGWAGACHQTALEILGYRFNRVPMLRVAARHPLTRWGSGNLDVDSLLAEQSEGWQRQGVRPANLPGTRLRQYLHWTRHVPDWPSVLQAQGDVLRPIPDEAGRETRRVRRRFGFSGLRCRWAEILCGDAVGGSRFDTLVCDGFLPLLVADGAVEESTVRRWWDHWFEGDVPASLHAGLRDLAACDEPSAPVCHGGVQGLLGWLLDDEKTDATVTAGVA